jgi:ketosteroid isomerase-like protein
MSGATPPPVREPDRAWWESLFAVIDARDAEGFADVFAADGEFRFANFPAARGREAIRAAAAAFFAQIGGCRHRLRDLWNGPGTAVCEGEVTYTRADGSSVVLPFVDVLGLRDGRITSYRVYIDNSPLFNRPH